MGLSEAAQKPILCNSVTRFSHGVGRIGGAFWVWKKERKTVEEINLGPRKWIVRTTNGLSAIFSPLFLAACPNRVKCLFYPSPSLPLSHSQHPNCPILIFMTLLFLRGFQKFCRHFHVLIPYPYISFRAPGFDTTVCFGSLSSATPSLTYISLVRNILCDFMSRWSILDEWQTSIASAT